MNLLLLVNNVIVYHQMTRISRTFVSFDSSDVFFYFVNEKHEIAKILMV